MSEAGVSVIIPAHREEKYLARTIRSLYATAGGPIEVLVVLQGDDRAGLPDEWTDEQVRVFSLPRNQGERVAMNLAARQARYSHLFRIDAHCDFSQDWDLKLSEVAVGRDLVVGVLTAMDEDYNHLPGHWYGLAALVVTQHHGRWGLEAKWRKANRDHNSYRVIEPNMAVTGCGMMLTKQFYEDIGGASEDLPAMGAIGEEFSLKTWLNNGRVWTRTDVVIGHIFGTGGYNTANVLRAQQMLFEEYGNWYDQIAKQFPGWADQTRRTDQPGPDIRTVTVTRVDTISTRDTHGTLVAAKDRIHRYVWLGIDHPGEENWTEKQIEEKYAPMATFVEEKMRYYASDGTVVDGPIYTEKETLHGSTQGDSEENRSSEAPVQ